MSIVWRDVDSALRSSRAQTHFAGAAYGVRDWLSDLDAGRPLIAAIDAMPDAADVRALLAPLQDSALTRLTEASRPTGEPEAPVTESEASRAEQPTRTVRRVPAASRFAAGDSHAMRSSSTRAAAHGAAAAANTPARVAALLARHEHVRRLVAEEIVRCAPWSDARRNERRIVPFAGHRAAAGESVSRSQGDRSPTPLTAMLARWSEVAATAPAQRLEAATGRALAASKRAQLDSPRALLDPASLRMPDAAGSRKRSAMPAEPAPPTAVLRIDDLAAPALPPEMQRPHAQTPAQAASNATSAAVPPAPTGESVLGRMAGALARIEERLAAPATGAEPPTQWLDEDDNLAERIHDILRRQAQRHGIDAP